MLNDITGLIGNTPLVKINKLNTGKAEIFAKLESFNPLHSIKDRTAMALIKDGEQRGLIKKDSTVIESTSGNTGIGLSFICATRGYKLILTMPDNLSAERKKLLMALGAKLELTPGSMGMAGAISRAAELAAEIPDSYLTEQFKNPANTEIHEKTTGPEIWQDTKQKIDILVAGVGTGGTITGIGRFLKKQNPKIQIVAVEPASSPVLSGGKASSHGIQGIGAGFIPLIYDRTVTDKIYLSGDTRASDLTRLLAQKEGIFAGLSSGAALDAALFLSEQKENEGKLITVIFPDSGERYLSLPFWNI